VFVQVLEHDVFFVAREKGRPAGYGALRREEGGAIAIEQLLVAPGLSADYRRQGRWRHGNRNREVVQQRQALRLHHPRRWRQMSPTSFAAYFSITARAARASASWLRVLAARFPDDAACLEWLWRNNHFPPTARTSIAPGVERRARSSTTTTRRAPVRCGVQTSDGCRSLAETRHAPRSSSLLITCVPGGGSGSDLCGARHVGWRETQRLAGCSRAAPERIDARSPRCHEQAEDRSGKQELELRRERARAVPADSRRRPRDHHQVSELVSPVRALPKSGALGSS
jgi:hypothetical protein